MLGGLRHESRTAADRGHRPRGGISHAPSARPDAFVRGLRRRRRGPGRGTGLGHASAHRRPARRGDRGDRSATSTRGATSACSRRATPATSACWPLWSGPSPGRRSWSRGWRRCNCWPPASACPGRSSPISPCTDAALDLKPSPDRPCAVLCGGENTPSAVAAHLLERGFVGRAAVGVRLGWPDETVTTGSLAEAAAGEFGSPAVLAAFPDSWLEAGGWTLRPRGSEQRDRARVGRGRWRPPGGPSGARRAGRGVREGGEGAVVTVGGARRAGGGRPTGRPPRHLGRRRRQWRLRGRVRVAGPARPGWWRSSATPRRAPPSAPTPPSSACGSRWCTGRLRGPAAAGRRSVRRWRAGGRAGWPAADPTIRPPTWW